MTECKFYIIKGNKVKTLTFPIEKLIKIVPYDNEVDISTYYISTKPDWRGYNEEVYDAYNSEKAAYTALIQAIKYEIGMYTSDLEAATKKLESL